MAEIVRLADMDEAERRRHMEDVISSRADYMQLFDQSNGGAWPERCDELCRWCMHKFEWFPVGIPVRWDEQRHKMVLRGYFCSFACADAYCADDSGHIKLGSPYGRHWLAVLARRAFGLRLIVRAPPREMLNRMSIEEFRAASGEACYTAGPSDYFVRESESIQANRIHTKQEEWDRRQAQGLRRRSLDEEAPVVAASSKRQRREQMDRFDRDATNSSIQSPKTIRKKQEEAGAKRVDVMSMLMASAAATKR